MELLFTIAIALWYVIRYFDLIDISVLILIYAIFTIFVLYKFGEG